jgi:hypothetical protein
MLILTPLASNSGVKFVCDKVDSVAHADGHSTVAAAGGGALRGSMVLDATGHSRRLVKFDKKFDPGASWGLTLGFFVRRKAEQ